MEKTGQLKQPLTLVLQQVGLDAETSAVLHRCTFVRADKFQYGF